MTLSRKTLGILFLALAGAALFLNGCWKQTEPVTGDIPEPPDSTYIIGGLASLTGDGAEYGIPFQTVAEIAVERVNAKGGINTTPLKIVWEDGKCNGKDAASAAQKLINIDKVEVILGGLCSSETLGAAPIAEENHVVMLSYASSSPDITNAGDYIFRTYPSDSSQGKVLAELALKQGLKKAGMLTEENDYTFGIAKVFQEVFEAGGGTVFDERFLPTDTDFRTQILRIRDAGADLVFVNPQTPAKADLLFKQIQEQPVAARLFANDVVMGWQEGITRYATLVEGMMGAEASFDDKNPEFMDLVSAYQQKTGKEALDYPAYSATTYDAVMILAEALTQFGNDADKIKEYLYTIKDRPSLSGKLTIDENGDPVAGHIAKVVIQGKVEVYQEQ